MENETEISENTPKLEPVTPAVKVKGKNGGARPGAGNKKGVKFKKSITKALALERLRQRIYDDTDLLYDSAKRLAINKGDTRAIDLIWQRGYGRPQESIDITSGGEKVVGFTYIAPKEDEK